MADLNGHEVGNDRYSQGRPKTPTPLPYSTVHVLGGILQPALYGADLDLKHACCCL